MRPSELASEHQIEKNESLNRNVNRGVKTAIGIGSAAIGARILPFLNEFITPDIAIKGISKISPKIGGMLQKGMEQGLDVKEGFEYLKNNLVGSQEKPKENRGIIEQYSGDLNFYLKELIGSGTPPQAAAKMALKVGQYKSTIQQLEKDHKTPFSTIVENEFGTGELAQQPAQQVQSAPPQQQSQQAQQPGQGQQALMSILQKIQQSRGG